MADQHLRGTLLKVRGRIEQGLGRLTGNRRRRAGGIAHQVEGSARQGVGGIPDAVRGHGDRPPTA